MKSPERITSPETYVQALPEARRSEALTLHHAICTAAPHLTPWMSFKLIAYGQVARQLGNRKPRIAPLVSLSVSIRYISIYIGGPEANTSLDPQLARVLGKVSIGGCCIRFKSLTDLHLEKLIELILTTCPPPEAERE